MYGKNGLQKSVSNYHFFEDAITAILDATKAAAMNRLSEEGREKGESN